MKFTKRMGWLWGILLVGGVLLSATGVLQWQRTAQEVERATSETEMAMMYAQQITASRDAPNRIDEHEMRLDLLAQLIERAADEATIPRRSLDRIWPQPAQRLGDSAYQRKPTQLLVRDVTLPQAVGFLHGMASGPSPLSIDSLRLTAPPGSAQSQGGGLERWNLETTVSHLLYKPIVSEGSTPVANATASSSN